MVLRIPPIRRASSLVVMACGLAVGLLSAPAAAQDGESAGSQSAVGGTVESSDDPASTTDLKSPTQQADADEPAGRGDASDSSTSKSKGQPPAPTPPVSPSAADAELSESIEQFRAAYKRYAREMSDYQDTVDSIVGAEYNQRVAKVNKNFNSRIDGLEVVERKRRSDAIAAFEEYLRRYPDTPGYTPDALFRLAELHFEKANDDYLSADEAYQSKLADYQAGKRADPPALPERDYTATMELFRRLIDQWPDYKQVDGAYYLLAYCNLQEANDDTARKLLSTLIETHPDSRFVPEAWIRIGEYWFSHSDSNEDLAHARRAYRRATEYPDSKFFDKALYKLAWTYYRMDNFDQAIKEFKRLVRYSDEQKKKTGQSGSVLRAESIQYIAVSLAEEDWDLDGTVDPTFGLPRVKTYLTGSEPYEREVLVELVDYMFDNTRYGVAAQVMRYALEKYPRHRGNPELHEKLIIALARDGQRDASFAERRNLLAYYGPESKWYEFQDRVGHKKAVRYADNLVKENLIQSATWFHEQAQKIKDEAVVRDDPDMLALARQKYSTAASAYADFLARYPNDKDVYQWNFFYAECLYYSEQYTQAYEQYRVVRELDLHKNKYREQAGFNAIKSVEYQMKRLADQGKLPDKAVPGGGVKAARQAAREQESSDVSADEMAQGDQQVHDIDAESMPDMLMQYITAMDRYVVLGLENDTDKDLDIKFAFQGAKLFYDFKNYDTARRRFNWIVDEYPDNELAYLSGSLILETYRREKKYKKLARAADKLSEVIKGEQADAIKKEVRQFKLGAMFKSAEKLFAAKKYDQAAQEYLRLVSKSPDHQYAPKALNNAAVAYEKLGKYESAMKLYERVYKEYPYPENPLAGYALYRVAVNSDRFFDFDKAVQSYLLFYDKYDGEHPQALADMGFDVADKRKSALRSAAVLSANLQRYAKAAKLYERYVGAYSGADDAAAVQWEAVKNWKKADEPGRMMDAVATYRRDFGAGTDKSGRVLEGMMLVADHYERTGRQAEATEWYHDIIAQFDHRKPGKGSSSAFYAAKARFRLAEQSFQDWKAIQINGNRKQQSRRLKKKLKLAKEIIKNFKDVWKYGNLEWLLASTFRIGNLYQTFAQSLYDVPVPFEEGSDEWYSYRDQLDQYAIPFEDKAVKRYEKTIKKAREEKVVNKWTKKTLEQLNKYKPKEYPLYKEERREVAGQTRTGTSYMSSEEYKSSQMAPASPAADESGQGGSADDEVSEQTGDDS